MTLHRARLAVLATMVFAAGCGGPQPLPTAQQNPFGEGGSSAGAPVVIPTPATPTVAPVTPAVSPASPGMAHSPLASPAPTLVAAAAPATTTPLVPPTAVAPFISPSPGPRPTTPLATPSTESPTVASLKPLTPESPEVPSPTTPATTGDAPPLDSREDWPQFRGPDGTGRAETAKPPLKWSAKEHLVFAAPLAGAGASSPVILGRDLYLTEYLAVGVDPKRAGRPASVERYILCLDADTGEERWRTEVGTDEKSPALNGFIAKHGYTSSTPISDGQRVFAYFGHVGLSAVESDGTVIGTKPLGNKLTQLGCWSSPISYGSTIILNASVEGEGLVALDSDGNEVWSHPVAKASAAAPVLVLTAEGTEELVLSGPEEIVGLNPETGEQLWRADGIKETVYTSPVAQDGVIYIAGGKEGTVLAIRAGGKGDVTYSHRVWKCKDSPEYASPVWHDGHLFLVGQDGRVTALVSETGQLAGQRQLPDATVFASPLIADGRLYVVTREKGVFVLSADEKLEILAQNRIAGDNTPFNASPAVIGSRIYLRSNKALYCFSEEN